jgi:hypothetical protein
MPNLTPQSLARNVYYYTVAFAAAVYVISHALLSTTVHWVYNRQARQRHWHGLAGLPAYKHQTLKDRGHDGQSNQQRSSKNGIVAEGEAPIRDGNTGFPRSTTHEILHSGKHWGIDHVPMIKKTLITADGMEITYYVMFPGNPKLQVLCNGLGVNANYTGFLPVLYRYGRMPGDYSFITWDYR